MKPTPIAIATIAVVSTVLVAILIWWIAISTKVVAFWLPDGGQCRWELNQWYSGRCLLSYFKDGKFRGRVRTVKGMFEWPIASFPGLSPQTAIVIYELDTTIAVFTIDFAQEKPNGIDPPQPLRETVVFSKFGIRACTKTEIAYLRRYIAEHPLELHNNIFALRSTKTPEQLQSALLYALTLGTVPREEREATLKDYSQPQIIPHD